MTLGVFSPKVYFFQLQGFQRPSNLCKMLSGNRKLYKKNLLGALISIVSTHSSYGKNIGLNHTRSDHRSYSYSAAQMGRRFKGMILTEANKSCRLHCCSDVTLNHARSGASWIRGVSLLPLPVWKRGLMGEYNRPLRAVQINPTLLALRDCCH